VREATYSQHAKMRMLQRRISELEVTAVLEDYHTNYTDEDGNQIYVGHPGSRRIVVVVRKGSDPPHVITVWD
jgi:hypothetical protein